MKLFAILVPCLLYGQAMKLTWTQSVSAGVDAYYIYRSEVAGGPYVKISDAVNGTEWQDTDVVWGGRYYYVVTARRIDTCIEEWINEDNPWCTEVGVMREVESVFSNKAHAWVATKVRSRTGKTISTGRVE